MCAWCERVRTSAGRWEEAGAPSPSPTEATHGICPDCLVDADARGRCARPGVPMSGEPRIELHGSGCSCRGGAWVLLEATQRRRAPGDGSERAEQLVLGLAEWRQLGKPGSLEVFQEAQGRVDNGERRQFERFEVTMPVRIARIATWRDPSAQVEETLAEVVAAGGALVRSRMAVEKGEMIRFAVGEAYETRAEVMYVSLGSGAGMDGIQRLGLQVPRRPAARGAHPAQTPGRCRSRGGRRRGLERQLTQAAVPAPRPSDSSHTRPPCDSTIRLTTARPTPEPSARGSSFSKRSSTRSRWRGSMPMPVVPHHEHDAARPRARAPPPARRLGRSPRTSSALSSRFWNTCTSRARSPKTTGSDAGDLDPAPRRGQRARARAAAPPARARRPAPPPAAPPARPARDSSNSSSSRLLQPRPPPR